MFLDVSNVSICFNPKPTTLCKELESCKGIEPEMSSYKPPQTPCSAEFVPDQSGPQRLSCQLRQWRCLSSQSSPLQRNSSQSIPRNISCTSMYLPQISTGIYNASEYGIIMRFNYVSIASLRIYSCASRPLE